LENQQKPSSSSIFLLGPVYSIDWCKTTAPGTHPQRSPRSSFRLGLASFTEDYRNRIAIVGLRDDERVLVEDDYNGDGPADFATLVEANHGYPATSLQWQPASAAQYSWRDRDASTELLATTGDVLRIWEYVSDVGASATSTYVGRQPTGSGHRLSVRGALSGVSLEFIQAFFCNSTPLCAFFLLMCITIICSGDERLQ
jgi:DDB1- and CUL4-associated factor 7